MAYAWFLGLIDKKTFEARLGGSVAGNKPEASVQSPPTPPEPAAEPGRLHTAGQSSPSEKQPRGSPAPRKKKVIWGLGIAAVILVAIFVIIANRNRQEEDPVFSPPYMIRIPGGTFTMGSPENEPGRSDDEGPQRQVTIRSFYIGKYEVTEAEYFYEINFRRLEYPQKPVTNISWYDAIEYCNKLSQREGLTPVYTIDKSRSDPNNQSDSDNVRWIVTWDRNANGYRLPTEAEWEYACRAGTTTAYNLGNSITENVAMFGYFGYGRAIEVGSFAANNWGLHDMHGNASEWCWDWYGAYAKISEIDPVGVSSGLMRVTRGGTAESGLSGVRSASRRAIIPDATGLRFGFRIARNAD
jgi:formylglycine-generating enzyme required for sulfatase activity